MAQKSVVYIMIIILLCAMFAVNRKAGLVSEEQRELLLKPFKEGENCT